MRAVAVAVLGAAAFMQPAARAADRSSAYEYLEIFSRVLAHVENSYVDDVDPAVLLRGAIRGMISTLDAHSIFLTPEEYERLKAETGGDIAGVGLEIARHREGLIVVAPIEGTPADRAGIRAGDLILAIDGRDTQVVDLGRAVGLLRGKPGTEVVLTVFREGFSRPRDVPISRERITISPVRARVVEHSGVIRVTTFQEDTASHLRRELERLREERDRRLNGVVLDLRNNPGGLLEEAIAVADIWLEEGTIAVVRGRGDREEIHKARRAGTEPMYPLVVLVNEGSASASEIVAGALRDNGRGVLMGMPTFGKGSVQTVVDLDDGSALKLTVARYHTPHGTDLDDSGVFPDIRVPDDRGRLEDEERSGGGLDSDPQLEAALIALSSWYIFRSAERDAENRAEGRQ